MITELNNQPMENNSILKILNKYERWMVIKDYKVSAIYIYIYIGKALWIPSMKGCIILELFTNNYLLINY